MHTVFLREPKKHTLKMFISKVKSGNECKGHILTNIIQNPFMAKRAVPIRSILHCETWS